MTDELAITLITNFLSRREKCKKIKRFKRYFNEPITGVDYNIETPETVNIPWDGSLKFRRLELLSGDKLRIIDFQNRGILLKGRLVDHQRFQFFKTGDYHFQSADQTINLVVAVFPRAGVRLVLPEATRKVIIQSRLFKIELKKEVRSNVEKVLYVTVKCGIGPRR